MLEGEQLASLTNYLGDTRALLASMCLPAALVPCAELFLLSHSLTQERPPPQPLTGVFTFVLVLAYLYLSSDAKEAKRE